ncbi:beta strand repeat-containing protein, partial [Chloroflexota bacterium]
KLKAGESLDYETEPTVGLDITATDSSSLTYTESFTITVNNVNEAPTDIVLDNATVNENADGAVIGNVSVTDPDSGDTYTYAVSDARFEVVGNQLKLKAGESLDYEAEATVSLDITATDSGSLAYTESFTITVNNVNEAPTDIALSNSTVAENTAGAVIGNTSVTDPDFGDTHTYAVSDARFEVVGNQLKLKAGESLDYETETTVSLDITATDSGSLTHTESFTIMVIDANDPPLATNDAFETIGNTLLEVSSSPTVATAVYVSGSVLDNDSDPEAGTITASINTYTSGAVVNMNADGTFTYTPPPSTTGTDAFTYDISDGSLSSTGTVTIQLYEEVWYVDNNVAGPGTGTSSDPFNTLGDAETNSGPNDIIYIFQGSGVTGQDNGITMKDNQQLIGEGVALEVNVDINGNPTPTLIRLAGSRPTIANTAGDGIKLALDNTIRGLNISDTTAGVGIQGAGIGTVTVNNMGISGTGGLVTISTGTISMTFDSLESTGGAGTALSLNGIGGTLTVTNGAGTDTNIVNASSGIGISNSPAGAAVSLGDTIVTGVAGINLNSNHFSSSIAFDSLSITTTNGAGLVANSGGIVNSVNQPTITSSGGPAIDVTNTTGNVGGPNQWSLTGVTSTNSVTDGVIFSSISQPVNLTNVDIDNPTNDGIKLANVTGAANTITSGSIDGGATNGNGINLQGVTGGVTVQGTGPGSKFEIVNIGTGGGSGDSGIKMVGSADLAVQFVECTDIGQSGDEHGINIKNPISGARSIAIADSLFNEIGDASAVGSGSAIDIEVASAASYAGLLDIDITNNDINGDGVAFNTTNQGVSLEFSASAAGAVDANISNNDIDGVREGIAVIIQGNAGSGGTRNLLNITGNFLDDLDNNGIEIDVTDDTGGNGNSNTRAVIDGNTLTAINAYTGAGHDPDVAIEVEARGISIPTLSVDITNNIIGGAADAPGERWDGDGIYVASSGSALGFSGTLSFDITGNTIDYVEDAGILVKADESATFNARLINNTLGSTAGDGIEIEFEGSDPATMFLHVQNNEVGAGNTYDIESRAASTLNIEQDAGGPLAVPGSYFGIPNLVSILNHNGNTEGGAAVTVGDVDNPGGANYNVLASGSTPAAN